MYHDECRLLRHSELKQHRKVVWLSFALSHLIQPSDSFASVSCFACWGTTSMRAVVMEAAEPWPAALEPVIQSLEGGGSQKRERDKRCFGGW